MAGLNLNQITVNGGSLLPTDKVYGIRSPFNSADDYYLTGSDFIAQFMSATTNVTSGAVVLFNGVSGNQIMQGGVPGTPNGLATLDSGGLVPSSQIPPLAINNTYVVANQAARLALSANVGDVAIQVDINQAFILQSLPASSNSNWVALPSTGGTVTMVSVVNANGVSAIVSNPSTTPSITFSLGAITPSSVAAVGTVTGSNLSGTNTGDQTITLTGNVTGSGSGTFAATIANNAVTYAQMQQASASTLIGNPSGSTANISEITLGAGLSFSGNTLVATGSGGTVTTVSVVNANGVSGSVANPTTTPAITLTLSAITPTSVNGVVLSGSGSPTLAVTGTSSISGSNTGDQTITLTSDVTGSGTGSFATTIAAHAVTYAKFQQAAGGNVVLGNPNSGVADYSEISLANSQLLGRPSSGVIGAISPDGTTCQISGSTLSVIGAPPTGTAGGDLTGTYPNPTIGANKTTYAKFQQVAASSLVGNPTGSLANAQGITLGAGLSFSGSTLVATGSGGTVTTVSVVTANGVSGSVANPTTTPAITFTLGAITPASVNSVVISGSGSPTLAVTGTTSISGSNTGDQTITLTGDVTGSGTGSFAATIGANKVTYAKFQQASAGNVVLANPTASAANYSEVSLSTSTLLGRGSSGNIAAISPDGSSISISGTTLQRGALTGDITASAGSASTTLATVNSNVGTFTDATITVNAKGLITAASSGAGAAAGYAFGLPYSNGKWIQGSSATNSATPSNVYTCILGKKAIIYGVSIKNLGGTAQTTLVGPSLPNQAIFAASVGAGVNVTSNTLYILNPGDNLLIANTTATAVVYVSFTILEVDSSYQLSTTTKTGSWINGSNTLYTVPVGKTATMMSCGGPGAIVGPTIGYYNNSGSASTSAFAVVDAGGNTRQITTSASIASGTTNSISFSYGANAGQTISVTSTQTGNQFAWVTMWET